MLSNAVLYIGILFAILMNSVFNLYMSNGNLVSVGKQTETVISESVEFGMTEDEIIRIMGEPDERNKNESYVELIYNTPIATEFGVSTYTIYGVILDENESQVGMSSLLLTFDRVSYEKLMSELGQYGFTEMDFVHVEEMEQYFKELEGYVYMNSVTSEDCLGSYFADNNETKIDVYEYLQKHISDFITIDDSTPLTEVRYYGIQEDDEIKNCTVFINNVVRCLTKSGQKALSNRVFLLK